MLNRLSKFLTAVSLVVLLATTLLCITAADVFSHSIRHFGKWGYMLDSEDRHLFVEVYHFTTTPDGGPVFNTSQRYTPIYFEWTKQFGQTIHFSFAGVGFGSVPVVRTDTMGKSWKDGTTWWIDFPDWLVILVSAILPLVALRNRIVRRRGHLAEQNGACRFCGYDLRATPERCPECGKVPVKLGAIA